MDNTEEDKYQKERIDSLVDLKRFEISRENISNLLIAKNFDSALFGAFLSAFLLLVHNNIFSEESFGMADVVRVTSQITSKKEHYLHGEWKKFYQKHKIILTKHESGVARLLYRLDQAKFPLLPDVLEYEEMPHSKFFELSWISRFFIHIPIDGDISPISLTLTSGGLLINFDTIDQMANHLIENVLYYQR